MEEDLFVNTGTGLSMHIISTSITYCTTVGDLVYWGRVLFCFAW